MTFSEMGLKMKIEFRNEKIHISGYVNAVERFSRRMKAEDGRIFIEKIAPGAFKRAIENATDIAIMHNHERVIGSTKKNGCVLREDSIGLHFEGDISDNEIIACAKKKQLVGWSFGFRLLKFSDVKSQQSGVDFERTVEELELVEVSIIDSSKMPAYQGTLIEARSTDEIEQRASEAEVSYKFRKNWELEKLRIKTIKEI